MTGRCCGHWPVDRTARQPMALDPGKDRSCRSRSPDRRARWRRRPARPWRPGIRFGTPCGSRSLWPTRHRRSGGSIHVGPCTVPRLYRRQQAHSLCYRPPLSGRQRSSPRIRSIRCGPPRGGRHRRGCHRGGTRRLAQVTPGKPVTIDRIPDPCSTPSTLSVSKTRSGPVRAHKRSTI